VQTGWEIEVAPGHNVTLKGTVQEVMARLEVDYPEYAATVHKKASAYLETLKTEIEKQTRSSLGVLAKRDNNKCWGPWGGASVGRIIEGISYLRSIGGRPLLGSGWGTCSRVSCSWNSGIQWCNDNPYPVELNSFSDIADAAWLIVSECTDLDQGITAGQRFHNDGINVVVYYSPC
jgi:hypothetical protein